MDECHGEGVAEDPRLICARTDFQQAVGVPLTALTMYPEEVIAHGLARQV